ncbi:M20/M25/M40 family metallo-hydrolase [Sinorhizobium meliloti]|uniref:M20/M25/M40 family metallo-hydrolase n=1 Tax=Rhizobium meliloti TaxID=382 RepID=UPI0003A8B673|nr:M20/M25/M40 family metallo-hydrolase [Sinorhizobium meliloti]
MAALASVLDRIDAEQDAAIRRLLNLLRIKSISTDLAYKEECRRAAEWLVADLTSIGFYASVRDTNGHPMVVAHHEGPAGAPHVLFYGHYDVQPVDPLELWTHDPFEPAVREGKDGHAIITGRGSSDDKGQLMTFVEACRAYKAVGGMLPCKVTIFLEGEEESGSPSMQAFLDANADELKADIALVCDTSQRDATTPAICVGLRGLVSEEVTIHAASRDLHSGSYGGAAANPIHVLAKTLGDMHDNEGRVTIPRFYDGVAETPRQTLDSWDALGETAESFLGPVGLSVPSGEKGRSILELVWARPTAEINGISGGYTGDGFKTVIPSHAFAKVSFRLVDKQDPVTIRSAFRKFVQERLPPDCRVEFKPHGNSPAIQLSHDRPYLTAAKSALAEEWAKEPIIKAMGGSIPVVGEFKTYLGLDALLVGFALPDDCIHSPNEKYNVSSFHKGQRSWARILDVLAKTQC